MIIPEFLLVVLVLIILAVLLLLYVALLLAMVDILEFIQELVSNNMDHVATIYIVFVIVTFLC